MAEKLKVSQQAEIRSNLYALALDRMSAEGLETEVVSKGAIIHLADGQFARLTITYCNPEKFNLDKERQEYAEKCQASAERKEKIAQKAREKAEKAKSKI